MCIRKYEEHNIAYNDPAFEVWREKYKQKSETIYPKLLKAISRKYIFFTWKLTK